MSELYHRATTRRGSGRAPKMGSKPLRHDRHGDLVVDDLDDSCGATVVPIDRYARLLALSPVARRS